jgi:hypothetical protein
MVTAKATDKLIDETGRGNLGEPKRQRVWFTVLPAILLVLTAYVWLVSIGTWTKWPQTYSHYDMLAAAFRLGQLYLEKQPSPALLALPNPYDPAMLKDVPYLMDASLYRGRYYLYFGPVPALILLVAKFLIPGVVWDLYLVFASPAEYSYCNRFSS